MSKTLNIKLWILNIDIKLAINNSQENEKKSQTILAWKTTSKTLTASF